MSVVETSGGILRVAVPAARAFPMSNPDCTSRGVFRPRLSCPMPGLALEASELLDLDKRIRLGDRFLQIIHLIAANLRLEVVATVVDEHKFGLRNYINNEDFGFDMVAHTYTHTPERARLFAFTSTLYEANRRRKISEKRPEKSGSVACRQNRESLSDELMTRFRAYSICLTCSALRLGRRSPPFS